MVKLPFGVTAHVHFGRSNSARRALIIRKANGRCCLGFDSLRGFKQLTCTDGKYSSPATGGCALVTSAENSAAATALASSNSSTATSNVTKNSECAGKEWSWGKDSSNAANYCVCARKPGYYGVASWLVWDCQSPWW